MRGVSAGRGGICWLWPDGDARTSPQWGERGRGCALRVRALSLDSRGACGRALAPGGCGRACESTLDARPAHLHLDARGEPCGCEAGLGGR